MSKLDDWTVAVAIELDVTQRIDRDLILNLARDVAHAVARPAAPLTAYLLGLAVAGGADPHEAAASVRELAEGWDPDKPPADTAL